MPLALGCDALDFAQREAASKPPNAAWAGEVQQLQASAQTARKSSRPAPAEGLVMLDIPVVHTGPFEAATSSETTNGEAQ